jgi:hypothetical protein
MGAPVEAGRDAPQVFEPDAHDLLASGRLRLSFGSSAQPEVCATSCSTPRIRPVSTTLRPRGSGSGERTTRHPHQLGPKVMHIQNLTPNRTPNVLPAAGALLFTSCRSQDERIDFLMANQTQLYRECPVLAIEDALAEVRARDSFVPKISHAADFQHAMAALAYCDHFVTRDGQLREHCRIVIRDLTLPCRVHASVGDSTLASV